MADPKYSISELLAYHLQDAHRMTTDRAWRAIGGNYSYTGVRGALLEGKNSSWFSRYGLDANGAGGYWRLTDAGKAASEEIARSMDKFDGSDHDPNPAPSNVDASPEPGEHPEARRWRLQLCSEQGRGFKLERENKALRVTLADTLKRLQDLEYEIEEHRTEHCSADVCCCDFLGV